MPPASCSYLVHRRYREFPSKWVKAALERKGLDIVSFERFPIYMSTKLVE